ncbi:MAG TPA: PhzF family phenazine biosynthesis protein [Gryllotalpicola sp.]
MGDPRSLASAARSTRSGDGDPRDRRFAQVDVFGREPLRGNPVAVVIDADGLTDAEMQRFATWTNLSETTFLLPPTTAGADYRVRIFTGSGELPFAGHPTLGTAHAWLGAGGRPATPGELVQECGIGLVTVRDDDGVLSFAAPELLRSGPVDEELLAQASTGLGIERSTIVSSQWVDNGPGWIAVELASVGELLAVEAHLDGLGLHGVGAFARYPDGDERLLEVRAFFGELEDPVTGSLNAGLAKWLVSSGRVTASYLAGQGQAIGRDGLVHVTLDSERIWIGGRTATIIEGKVTV